MTDTSTDGPLVLIVEDELLIAASLEIALDMKGYRILGPAATVAEAEALLDTQRPDMALIDYRLATTTTEALLPRLDAEHIPVCVLSGYSRSQLPAAYAPHALLEKPFPMQKLMTMLKSLSTR
jgi:DNA-binding NtrC family response regulator